MGGAPQYSFTDGKLTISHDGEVTVIRGWPVPTAVRKNGRSWLPFLPEFRLVNPYRPARPKPSTTTIPNDPTQLTFDFAAILNPKPAPSYAMRRRSVEAQRRKRALDGFRFSLPREVARAIEPFRSHQWPLLVFLAHDPGAIDLAKCNPALAYAVAMLLDGCPHMIGMMNAGSMKQKDLLSLLGIPGSPSLVGLFRKIAPESIDGQNVRTLLPALSSPASEVRNLLAHAPKINLGVMQLVLDARIQGAVTPSLVAEVAADKREKYRAEVARLLAETLAMEDELGNRPAARKFSSIQRLREVYLETASSFQQLRELKETLGPLPLPPLPEIDGKIVPLRTKHDLVTEGKQQHNCVASYAGRVLERDCFIYRVLHPERATLSIERGPDRQWHIGELKAPCNATVRPETRLFVQDWLDRYRLGGASSLPQLREAFSS